MNTSPGAGRIPAFNNREATSEVGDAQEDVLLPAVGGLG